MSLARFSVNQSLFVNLVSVIVIIIGLVEVSGMNREIFPNVNFDMVQITTVYPGATPLDVEKLISVPIEKELKEVDGIKEIKSSSSSGSSFVLVKIDPDERDKKKVVNDIRSAVDRVKDLPADINEDPVVTEITTRQYPIIEVSLSGDISEKDLQYHADNLEDELEDIEGVARIVKSGYRDKEIQIHVDPKKMREQYVSFDEIIKALSSRNISVPAGEINTETSEYNIRTTGEFYTAGEIENIIIRANDAGNWLKIRDIAEVKDSFKKEDVVYKTFGTRSINLVVMKKESGDAIRIVDRIKKTGDRFLKNSPEALKISYVNDYSFFARRRLNVLRNNGWGSIVLVAGSLLLLLQWRVALVTALGIPFALFMTFIVMNMMGITINLISMFGLIVVLGMLVDEGIIVAENVYRYMEEGTPPKKAAVKGAEEVQKAVMAAVLTTIAAFLPLLFMTGIIGRFIRNIPTVLIVALLASLGEALIVLPSHLADFVKIKYDASGRPVNLSRDMPWFKNLIGSYKKVLNIAMRRKYLVLAGLTITLLVCGILAFSVIKFILFPSAGINYFFIRLEAPIGTPLAKTNELVLPVEKIVSEIPSQELESFITSVGNISEDRHDPFAGQASHLAQITVYLTPDQDRKRKVDEIINDIRKKTEYIQGFTELRFDKAQTGPPVGKAVEARIRGESFETLDTIAKEYMDYLKTIEGTLDVTWDHKPGKEEIRVKVEHNKATSAGLNVAQIANTVRAVFEGSIATKIRPVKAEEETDVTVMFPEKFSDDIKVFENILIQNKSEKLIPLKNVAAIEKVPGNTTIHHLDGKRVVTVSANIDTKKITSLKATRMLENKFKGLSQRYPGYSVKYGGEQEETKDSLRSLLKAFFFAFLIVYLILSYSFKSIIQPLIIMLSIPFGLIGVIFAFFIHGMPLSFMAILGIVGLNGIVVNDSIVLIDFINKLRTEGMNKHDSILKAGEMRLRPVMLTTITTVGGLSTVAYGIGGKDPFLVPMALSICWGLSFATLLTLIVIPCIYSIVDDIALKITKHSSMLRYAGIDNNSTPRP